MASEATTCPHPFGARGLEKRVNAAGTGYEYTGVEVCGDCGSRWQTEAFVSPFVGFAKREIERRELVVAQAIGERLRQDTAVQVQRSGDAKQDPETHHDVSDTKGQKTVDR